MAGNQGDVYEFQGQQVELPCIVRDAGSGNVIYMVPSDVASRLLPGDAFEIAEAAPGLTQLVLCIVDYRDNDLGDYDEVGIIFTVRPVGTGEEKTGTFIYKLPVNQSFTCEAGCGIWGFPKTVEPIQFEYGDDFARCRLEMDGRHVFTLSVPRDPASELPSADLTTQTYTYIEGVAHETPFGTSGSGATMNPGGEGVVLELGDHPIAGELRELGLEGATPVLSMWVEHFQGSFGSPRKL